ncbi:hypothetical protein BHM03_00010518 [Ensete ventricosum]|uniref:Uncharacterized protein n=1 Tax=Ensete ventricosum TaxID=4639 RepID=A0A445MCW7_ENSVE|nr:hypothetical protein BHM03_00010518 [Ensete ventricosum]
MLQRVHQYIAIEALVAGKRDQSKQSRAKQPRGHPSGPPKRREDRSDMLPSRPPPIPLNSTRTEIFLQIQERGLMKTLNLMKTRYERHDKRSMQVLRSGENNASKKSSNRSASRPTEGDASGNEWLALLDRNETSKLFWG